MPTRLLLLTTVLLLSLAAPASAVIVPGKGMAGLELGDSIDHAIDVIGYPDKTWGEEAPTGEFVETYTYEKLGIKIGFYHGPGQSLVAGEFRAYKGSERTAEGIGKGTMRKTIKAKLGKRVKCETFKLGKRRIRSCHIGKFRPSKPVTEFRIDSKGRVSYVSVRYVSD